MYTEGEGYYYEYWSNNSNPTSGYTVYLKTTLPAGTYQMTAKCKAGWGGGAANPDGMQAITFSAGETDGSNITSTTLADAQIDFVQEAEGEVKIGLKAHEGNTCNWMGIGYVKLFKVPQVAIALDEDVDFTPESAAGNVTLMKTLYPGWNTLVLPCGLDAAHVSLLKSTYSAALYKYENANEDKLNFSSDVNVIVAHTPYLLYIGSDAVDGTKKVIPLGDQTISTGTPVTEAAGYSFVGTYAEVAVAEGDYILGEDAFKYSNGGNKVKPFRAYIKKAEEATGARVLKIVVDGEVTAIKSIDGQNISNDAIFNLAGQRVVKAQKGLYIQNGKKVIK
jgi:hypothetical protein